MFIYVFCRFFLLSFSSNLRNLCYLIKSTFIQLKWFETAVVAGLFSLFIVRTIHFDFPWFGTFSAPLRVKWDCLDANRLCSLGKNGSFFYHVPNPFVWRRILKQSTFIVKYHLKSSILNEHGLDENGCRLFILLQWMQRMWSTRPRIQSRRHNIICIDIHFELQTVCFAHRTHRHIVVICK